MKKIFRLFSCLLVVLVVISVLPTNINASKLNNVSKEIIVERFNELQREIDKVLKINGNKYVFDKEDIIRVIENSNFDFDSYNSYFNTNYTKDSFIKDVIYRIENTDLNFKSYKPTYNNELIRDKNYNLTGTYCGKNGYTTGWNYMRGYLSKSRANEGAEKLDELSRNVSLAGSTSGLVALIPEIGPILAAVMAFNAGVISWYSSTLAASIRKNNNGRCGVVVDVNAYTYFFTVWSQEDFDE